MKIENYKLELYKPSGEFLGELIVDNLTADLKLNDISAISFEVPSVINGVPNNRIEQILDTYELILYYGDGAAKGRFVIYETPMSFSEYKYNYRYSAYSIESKLEQEQIVSWPGIEKQREYFKAKPGPTTGFPIITGTPDYIEFTINSNISDEDLEILEVRVNNDIVNKTPLIPFDTGLTFQRGYYNRVSTNTIRIALDDQVKYNDMISNLTDYYFEIYDNPNNSYKPIVYNNTSTSDFIQYTAEKVIVDNYTNETINSKVYEIENYYSKDGIKLEWVLNDILANSDFTFEIDPEIADKYRSNIDLNNISIYQSLKNLAESYNAVLITDTIDKKLYFYPDLKFGENNNLTIQYGTYLKAIDKQIDTTKIVTKTRGLGKDNLSITLITPTQDGYWEDYSYYLDEFLIKEGSFSLANSNDITSVTITNMNLLSSRWMSRILAEKISKWQFIRDYYHAIFDGQTSYLGLTVPLSSDTSFFNIYSERKNLIERLVKEEANYDKLYSQELKYSYLKNYYDSKVKNDPSDTDSLNRFNEYSNLYTQYQSSSAAKKIELNYLLDDINAIGDAIQSINNSKLNKNLTINEQIELKNFTKEFIFSDNTYDNDYDLLNGVIEYVEENKYPKVTIDINIIDILAALDSEQDKDKLNIGDKINVYFPEFNIDLEAQIKELNIDFDNNQVTLVISTTKNYNKGRSNTLYNILRRVNDSNKNILKYNNDNNKHSFENSVEAIQIFEQGVFTEDTQIGSGLTTAKGLSPIILDTEGMTISEITVDPYTETIDISTNNRSIKFANGIIYIQDGNKRIEMSVDNGFSITNSGNIKTFYVDQNGNVVFNGILTQTSVIQTPVGDFTLSDTLDYSLNITGGSRSILYNSASTSPVPVISTPFVATPKIGNDIWTNVVYSWSAEGSMNADGVTTNTNSFTPNINPDLQTDSTEVTLTVDFKDNQNNIIKTLSEVIPIFVTRVGDTGAGSIGASARTIKLFANDFVINYDQSNVAAQTNITFNTQIFGYDTNATITYEFYIDGLTTAAQSGSNSSFVLTNANFPLATDSKTIYVKLLENGNVMALDGVTIYGIKEGDDALLVTLSNDSHTISKDYLGNFTLTGSGTDIKVYQGTTELSPLNGTLSAGQFKILSSTVTPTGYVTVSPTYDAVNKKIIINDFTSINANAKTVTINYQIQVKKLNGSVVTLNKIQSLSISEQGIVGPDGLPAKALFLNTTSNVFRKAKNGTITPSSITLTAYLQNLSGTVTFNPNTGTGITVAGNVMTVTNAYFASNTSLTVTASFTGGYSDSQTIVLLEEGLDTINPVLSNENHTFVASVDGIVTDYTASGTTIKVFEGDYELTYQGLSGTYHANNGTFTITRTGTNVVVGTNSGTGTNTATFGNVTGVTSTADTPYITYILYIKKRNGTTVQLTQIQNFSKSKQGAQGPQGIEGPQGPNGESLFTWIKYADSPTSGMSDSPDNKKYIGIAYNKTTATESSDYADYTWSFIEGPLGPEGPQGPDGESLYTWIKYADSPTTGMSDSPTDKKYLGIAYNKESATESTNYTDYSWSLIEGPQGPEGPEGPEGPTGSAGPGVVYRGQWAASQTYTKTNELTEVVLFGGTYYICTLTHTSSLLNEPTDVGSPWTVFGATFKSVATGLLLAENAHIKKTLTLGTNELIPSANITINGEVTNPYISIAQTSTGYGNTGIFIGTVSNNSALSLVGSENHLKWSNGVLDIKGDIGGSVGEIEVGNILINSSGIIGKNTLGVEKFKLNSETGLIWAVDGEFEGQIVSSNGFIGNWKIGEYSIESGSGATYVGLNSSSLNDYAFWAGAENPISAKFSIKKDGTITATNGFFSGQINTNIGTLGSWNINASGLSLGNSSITPTSFWIRTSSGDFSGVNISYNDIVFYGTGIKSIRGLESGANIRMSSTGYVSVHSDSSYVYASRTTISTAPEARILVGTGGVSTKIVKDNISDLDYNEIENFIEIIKPVSFRNKIKNKDKISIIIEDEEDKNLPFSNMLFKREDKLYRFYELPEFLIPYINQEEIIQKEYDKDNNIVGYYFSPKVIDDQTYNGLLLASIKNNHMKIKKLEEEKESLKNEIENIKNYIGMI